MEPMNPMEHTPDRADASRRAIPAIDWAAVLWGAVTGLVLLIATATLQALLDREIDDFDESGWRLVLFVVLIIAYGAAGFIGATRAREDECGAPLTHGALAGLGALVLWLPVRAVIWLVRDENRGLFHGSQAALRPGQVFGQLVIAAGLGTLGGYLAARMASGRAARSASNAP